MKVRKFFIGVLLAFGLVFTACSGGGGGSSTTTTGSSATITAVDGYIRDAIVTDSAGQIGVYTSNGQYTFADSINYPLFLTGGVFEDTGVPFDIDMTAQEGSLLISPITTFLANNSTLLGKFANLGLGASTLSEFSVDYIDTNNNDLAKLSQLLYLAHKDTTLLNAFKTRILSSNPTNLDEMFTFLETDINATMSSGYAVSYRAFLAAVKALTTSPSEYETELKVFKASLNVDLTPVTHHGVTYGLVLSPYTGNIWLDRNLGASQVCTARDDAACYGDYYQWGRKSDGHQESDSTTTILQATDINDAGADYILSTDTYNYDWAEDADTDGLLRKENWSKTDGSSICPVGYHIPTIRELRDEIVDSTVTDEFNSFLKLPFAGYRRSSDGSYASFTGSIGSVWSNTLSSFRLYYSDYLSFSGNGVYSESSNRATGMSVRCLKDDINLVPTATSFSVSTDENIEADIRLLGNDGDGDTLAYTVVTNPLYGTLSGTAPDLTYNPSADYIGNDTFTYKVNDGKVNSKIATVSITIGDVPIIVTHNGIAYGTVTSPYTGQIWLDRNLGASQVCTAITDTACYGDYYQWGRNSDGHQKFNSTTTILRAENINNPGTDFILLFSLASPDYDWTIYTDSNGFLRSANWSKTDGTSVCPGGYRVPTITELLAETAAVNNNVDAFASFLKLPSAGYRKPDAGTHGIIIMDGGYVYSSSPISFSSSCFNFSIMVAGEKVSARSRGYPVRCVKSKNMVPTATSFSVSTDENIEVDITLSGHDGDGDSLTYTVVTNPLHGTLSGTVPNLVYNPTADYDGVDSFTYKVNDGLIDSEIATVSVTINDISVTIIHNGVTYGTVISPFTGKRWLDRNLGASRICTALDDTACYGDYYQWGRNSDGHEKFDSNTTNIQATDINSAGTDFVTSSDIYDYDWAQAVDGDGFLRAANWSKTDGTSVCPVGYRVPIIREILDETLDASTAVTNTTDAFNNFLKLPSAGYRDREDASMKLQGIYAGLWASSVTDVRSDYIYISSTSANTYHYYRSSAKAVRCILDESLPDTTSPTFTSSNVASVAEDQTSAITLVATDLSSVTYSISEEDAASFNIDSISGVVTFKTAPDYETQQNYSFTATATDSSGNSATQSVTITILYVESGYITHNGTNYLTVVSPYTGKVWLDRNLGASQVCTALDDTACYGDYYQWGRNFDGHQESNSVITTTQATDIDSAGSEFIILSSDPYDWSAIDSDGALRAANWSKIDGTSVCPVGFRVSTATELEAETTSASTAVKNNTDAFNNFLKLPSAGYRYGNDGSLKNQGSNGIAWTSSISGSYSSLLNFDSHNASVDYGYSRTYGFSVRCIKN